MDPIIGGALIGGGFDLLGGLFGSSSAKAINAQNIKFAREYRDWQGEMSNTEVYRRVQDLIRSGLNPMLGYSSAASSPSVSPPQLDANSEGGPISSALGRVGDRASQLPIMRLTADNLKQQNRLLKAQAFKEEELGTQAGIETRIKKFGEEFEKSARVAGFQNSSVQYSQSVQDLLTSGVQQRLAELDVQVRKGDVEAAKAKTLGYKIINDADLPNWVKVILRQMLDWK